MEDLEEVKEKYWRVLSRTRQSGRISPSVKKREEEYWEAFDTDIVLEALNIHISQYPSYRESYTRGIMRNLKRKKESTGTVRKENKFNNFDQRNYSSDFYESLFEN